MSMTEDRARERWCPYSNHHPSQEASRCIASACMAWRWDMERVIDSPDAWAPMRTYEKYGHCGLAGQP